MKEKKLFGKLNIIDFLVIILLVVVVAFVGYKLLNRGSGSGGESNRIGIKYTVKCEEINERVYDEALKYIPSQVMSNGELCSVNIVGVEKEPHYVMTADGQWVEEYGKVDLVFSLEGTVANTAVITSEVGSQEIRVGKSDHIVKSEFIEVTGGVITSVEWDIPE
ncbi:DUF4330 domain-containing protein [Oscillibacter sp. MSJ-2]|uniref:DUF4330 domain-containing protein n=1 Tax=Dysosmobacter acutus TaxID=2841504 RepID=A0ABS6F985_9FIRM|nr:DUF4330 domain-containing protein [Dysosmobacter acutus]MBU5626853.1 DUF4330 domain-containing protein [Dysosmobacter acutus]